MRHGFTLIELMIVIAIIAIIAAIAIPNLMESRVTANEAAASASLKSGVFPAQVQFQAGGYQDVDQDNVGEYGTLRALAGLDATSKIGASSIHLLQGPLATNASWAFAVAATDGTALVNAYTINATGTASGYKFTSFVPGETASTGDATLGVWNEGNGAPAYALPATSTANNAEKYWVAACMPEKFGDTGRRPFLISSDGQVRSPAIKAVVDSFWPTVGGPVNGNPVTAANFAIGVDWCMMGGGAAPTGVGLTDLENMSWASCPVYSK